MKLKVQLFGIFREKLGDVLELECPEDTGSATLKKILGGQHAIIKEVKHYMLAINQEYSSRDVALKESDEIALIPPVAGG